MDLEPQDVQASAPPEPNEVEPPDGPDDPPAGVYIGPPLPSLTMQQILHAMTAPERMLDRIAEEGLDCAELVGDLKLSDVSDDDARAALGEKVDGLRYVVDQFEAYAERTDARAQGLAAKAKAAWNQAGRIRTRLLEQMTFYEFEKLPGIDFTVERKRASNPSMITTRTPCAMDMLEVPEYVAEIPTSYSWRSDLLKKSLKQGATHSFARLQYSYRVEFVERDRPDVTENKMKKGKRK